MDLARYNKESGIFEIIDKEKLDQAGIDFEMISATSLMTLYLLVLKAAKSYFKEEKIISFRVNNHYFETSKKALRLVDILRSKGYSLPPPINLNKFTQEQILQFNKEKNIYPLLGMMTFIEKEYEKKFEKK
jgi:hypothetical protein